MKNPLGEPLPPPALSGADDYDPRGDLVARLLAYEKLRRVADFWQSGGVRIRGGAWTRPAVPVEIPDYRPQKPRLDADKLAAAFGRIAGQTNPPRPPTRNAKAAAAPPPAPRRPGRPPRSDEPTASAIVRMPESVVAAAREYAASQRRPLNAVFLDGLARELAASGQPLPPLLSHPDSAATGGI